MTEDPIRVTLIVAAGRGGEIGRSGQLLFRLKADLAHFRRSTAGRPLIMGRKTWDSLPRKPLPGRPCMVLSRDVRFAPEGARVFTDPGAGLAAARALAFLSGGTEVCVIGGEEIYRIFMPFAGRILLSDVDAEAEADAFFTIPDRRQWSEVSAVRVSRDADNEHDFIIRDLKRRASP